LRNVRRFNNFPIQRNHETLVTCHYSQNQVESSEEPPCSYSFLLTSRAESPNRHTWLSFNLNLSIATEKILPSSAGRGAAISLPPFDSVFIYRTALVDSGGRDPLASNYIAWNFAVTFCKGEDCDFAHFVPSEKVE
jgi:hypothetical protein